MASRGPVGLPAVLSTHDNLNGVRAGMIGRGVRNEPNNHKENHIWELQLLLTPKANLSSPMTRLFPASPVTA